MNKRTRVGIGQDSHRFLPPETSKPCTIAGVTFEDTPGFDANSDGDIVFHAICNAITSLTGVLILGGLADDLCLMDGITDSRIYLQEGLKSLGNTTVVHVAITIEAKKPHFRNALSAMRDSVADAMGIYPEQVGITATTGEGLTEFGVGKGAQAIAILTVQDD